MYKKGKTYRTSIITIFNKFWKQKITLHSPEVLCDGVFRCPISPWARITHGSRRTNNGTPYCWSAASRTAHAAFASVRVQTDCGVAEPKACRCPAAAWDTVTAAPEADRFRTASATCASARVSRATFAGPPRCPTARDRTPAGTRFPAPGADKRRRTARATCASARTRRAPVATSRCPAARDWPAVGARSPASGGRLRWARTPYAAAGARSTAPGDRIRTARGTRPSARRAPSTFAKSNAAASRRRTAPADTAAGTTGDRAPRGNPIRPALAVGWCASSARGRNVAAPWRRGTAGHRGPARIGPFSTHVAERNASPGSPAFPRPTCPGPG